MWKKVISLFLVLFILPTLIGCGGGGGTPTTPSTPSDSEEDDLFLAKVVDSTSDIQFIAEKDGEVLAFLAEKDIEGNPTGVKGVIYLSSEDEYMTLIPGEDGLPEMIIDSKGNRIEFKNYTDSTVDVYWYNEYGELIEGPVTVDVDEQDLLELQQINSSLNYKMARGKTNDIITWSILGINGIVCVGGLYITAGVPSPFYGICASTILGITAALTDIEILDAAAFTVSGATCYAAGGLSLSCISLLNTIEEEMTDSDSNSDPIIYTLIAESTYVKAGESVNITCCADDADEFENFTFWWQAEDGDFIAMPYIYQTNLPSWESNVPWKCKSTIIWTAPDTAGNYEIVCTVIDKAGETDSKSVSISVEGTNHAPVISSLTANPSSININETTAITCTASDEDVGDTLTYTWTKNVGSFEGSTSGPSVTWRAPSTADIYTVVGCEVSDGEGGGDYESINIIVTEPDDNHAPVITSTAVTSATKTELYSYDVNATDSDGDTLVYSLTTKPSGMTINSSTGLITWTPSALGSYNVTVKASDGELFDTQSFTITVSESPPPTKTLTSLTVSPDTMSFTAAGQQKAISEITLGWSWSDGTTSTSSLAKGDATYSGHNTSVAKIVMAIPSVYVESVGTGSTNVKVSYTYNGVTKYDYIAVSVEIAPAELQYIEAYPKNMAFDLNDADKCDDVTQVVAWYSDGSWENIDINSVSYLSNNTGVATVNSNGTVCGVGEGNTTIKVTYQGEYDTISVSVTDTGISPPSVTTLDPIYDGGYYIAMKGKIQSTGGENAYEIGFEYQDLAGGSVETINAYGNYEDGRAWNMTLVKGSDITYGHSYKYRAYAVNSAGTGYGTWDTFTVN